jgi:hypothetical protein
MLILHKLEGDSIVPPLRLTDAELDAVMHAARPLDVRVRDAFLQEVANALRCCNGEVGPGTVHRAIADVQRKYLPAISGVAGIGKYR